AMAGGEVKLAGARADHLRALLQALRKSGARITQERDGLQIRARGRPRPVSIVTQPHPGFPTDLQAPWMAYMCLARGVSRIREEIFEKRFIHAAELGRMGARIGIEGNSAVVEGVSRLAGA